MNTSLWAAASGALLLLASPAAAQSTNATIKQDVASCNSGQNMACLNAAQYFEDIEDSENPTRSLEYSKRACDGGATLGCRLYTLTVHRAAITTHQRVLKTLIEGDPKGEWRTIGDLNSGIEQARGHYQEVQRMDPSRNDDWPGLYAELDSLKQLYREAARDARRLSVGRP